MNIIGVMSGTSLDGLDLALCRFTKRNGRYAFSVRRAVTVPYDAAWRQRLATVHEAGGLDLARTDRDFGRYIGACCKSFAGTDKVDLIASHGHTVFHRPDEGLTLQIGDGAAIAAVSGIRTVADFRRQDVAMGGQGAPLVPIGDELLFGHYAACLNLGGFANVSFRQDGRRVAFDIGPFNMVFNRYAQREGLPYDDGGGLARRGARCAALEQELDALPFYTVKGPKSLGREWVDEVLMPLIDRHGLAPCDVLHTYSHHIARQIAAALPAPDMLPGSPAVPELLVTGGGAYNRFAIGLLQEATPYRIVIPDDYTVNYKEALIFAFLGLLRIQGRNNTLASVTGAPRDHAGGTVFEA